MRPPVVDSDDLPVFRGGGATWALKRERFAERLRCSGIVSAPALDPPEPQKRIRTIPSRPRRGDEPPPRLAALLELSIARLDVCQLCERKAVVRIEREDCLQAHGRPRCLAESLVPD